jgi:hypothetical protein
MVVDLLGTKLVVGTVLVFLNTSLLAQTSNECKSLGELWVATQMKANPDVNPNHWREIARTFEADSRGLTQSKARELVDEAEQSLKLTYSIQNRLDIGGIARLKRDEYLLCLWRGYASGASAQASVAGKQAVQPHTPSASNLDTPERLQAAQANQQQADRAFAGKKRVHDDNAITEQPTTGSREGTATNRGPVRVNVAYCMDSYKRAYSGSLKCSAQRFGYISLEPGQTVDVLGPNSGLQALTMGCKHPTKPYDVEFVNDGLSGRCAAY